MQAAVGVDTIDAVEIQLFEGRFVATREPIWRIGEEDRAIASFDYVVRAIEPFAVEVCRERRLLFRPYIESRHHAVAVVRHQNRVITIGEQPVRTRLREFLRPRARVAGWLQEDAESILLRPAIHRIARDI